jgi:multiple sugar transport system permease protein
VLLFVGVPVVLSTIVGFFNVNGFGSYRFIGFANYAALARDTLFLHSLEVTGLYVAAVVPTSCAAGLMLALLLRRNFVGVGLLRAAIFSPNTISLVVIGVLWPFLLSYPGGLINQVLNAIGIGGRSWLGVPSLALPVIIVVSVWFWMGFYMLIYLAGLQDIPQWYYEAAALDGASHWRAFWNITWPLLRPTTFFVVLIATISSIAGGAPFDLVYVMTGGGPDNATSLILVQIYRRAFEYNEMGYAAAMASVIVGALFVLTVILMVVTHGGTFDRARGDHGSRH